MEYLNYDSLALPLATAAGVVGFGALKPPMIIQDLLKNEWFQWFLVFVLIYQGGSGQQPILAAVATIVTYVIFKVLDMMYQQKEGYYY